MKESFTFGISATTTPTTEKITKKDYWKLDFQQQTVTVDDLKKLILQGRLLTGIYRNQSFNIKEKRIENFCQSNVIAIDIDNCDCTMEDYVDVLKVQPTIAYTSYSDGLPDKGYRFRFLYVFDEPITTPEEFTQTYEVMCAVNNIDVDSNDDCMKQCNQGFWGNGSDRCRIIGDGHILNLNDFKNEYHSTFEQFTPKSIINYNKKEHTTTLKQSMILSFNDSEFEHYWLNGSDEEVLTQMHHYHSHESTQIEFNDGELWRELSDTPYYVIKHKWELRNIHRNGTGKMVPVTVKVKDGEGRRKRIFMSLIRRRLIDPTLTIEHLCYAALCELVYYTQNNPKDFITRKQLAYIANNALHTELSRYAEQLRDNKKYIMNKEEVKKQGIPMAKAVGHVNGQRNKKMKEQRYAEIMKFYDPTKTDKDNLKTLQENGINISIITLKRFRKENGLTKYNKTKVSSTTIKKNTTDTLKRSMILSEEKKLLDMDAVKTIITQLHPYYQEGVKINEFAPHKFEINFTHPVINLELWRAAGEYLIGNDYFMEGFAVKGVENEKVAKNYLISTNC